MTDRDGTQHPADAYPADATAPVEQAPEPTPSKGRGGAPKGNSNALKHGLFARTEVAKRRKSKHWKAAEAEAKAILEDLRLAGDALAERIARRMTQSEVESALLEVYVERRGRMTKEGELKPAYGRMLDLRQRDLNDCARLLDRVAALPGSGEVVHRVIIEESPDAEDRTSPASVWSGTERPENDEHEATSTSPEPEPTPQEPVERAPEPESKPPTTSPKRFKATREKREDHALMTNWATGRTVYGEDRDDD